MDRLDLVEHSLPSQPGPLAGGAIRNSVAAGRRLLCANSNYKCWPRTAVSVIGGAMRANRVTRHVAVVALALLAVFLPGLAGAELSGPPVVVDGDSLEVAGQRIRLHGVDAPERKQTCVADGSRWPCGERAARALATRASKRTIFCTEKDLDRYGRIAATCRLEGVDLNAWLVTEGWALAYRRYSDDYVEEEAHAQAAGRGIWRGEFVPPWKWRRGERLAGTAKETSEPDPACRIKGNIGRNGERIYHLPGGQSYERTRINPSRGERWFCSERDAIDAGWRPAWR